MPQANEALRSKWHGKDCDGALAFDKIGSINFIWARGGIIRPVVGYTPNAEELSAIDYLCQEWDYGYDPKAR